jgi:hypothetical protein
VNADPDIDAILADLPPFAISLKQPWCWAMLYCGKDVENRRWQTRFRGPVVIHASLSWDSEGEAFLRRLGYDVIPSSLPRGAFVGTMRITDCWRYSDATATSGWAFGPWCFSVEDAKPLATPIPAKGQLNIYRWKDFPTPQPASLALPLEPADV